jgi:hypothetical protein
MIFYRRFPLLDTLFFHVHMGGWFGRFSARAGFIIRWDLLEFWTP